MVRPLQYGTYNNGLPQGWVQTAKSVPSQGVNQQASIFANRTQPGIYPGPGQADGGGMLQLFQMLISIMMQFIGMLGGHHGPMPMGQPGGQQADQGIHGMSGGIPGLSGINNNQNNATLLDNAGNAGQNQNTGNFGNLFNLFGSANANAQMTEYPPYAEVPGLNDTGAQHHGNVVVAPANTPIVTSQSNYYVGADQNVTGPYTPPPGLLPPAYPPPPPGGTPFINTNQNNATYLDNANNSGTIQNTGNFGNMNIINIYFGCQHPGSTDGDVQPGYKPPAYEGGKSGRLWGDPHFEDPDGGRYDVQGEPGKIYNILSDQNVQFNAHFAGHGGNGVTVADEVGFLVGDNRIHFGLEGAPTVNNKPMVAGQPVDLGNNQSVVWNDSKLTVNTSEYNFNVERFANHMNASVEVTGQGPYSDYVAPQGLLGQAFDNGVKNNGTGSQGQGAIQGTYKDYEVPDLYSNQFKYNRYGVQVGRMTGTDTNNDGVPDTLQQVMATDNTTVLYTG